MEQSAWVEASSGVGAAPDRVEVLPVDSERAAARLTVLGVTTRSWLGSVVANSGGLVVGHGWLRVLGAGHEGLSDVAAELDARAGRLIVAFDVMGGQFGWGAFSTGLTPTNERSAVDE
ncbi:DUF2625 family protein [Micromonospora sp. IBHARD004]|uniref:DUF2625 family protein n=1 Tax=Micromonospora sp. IBHARD004 TaxID=3457764 RepID=UPI00405967DE